MEVAARVAAAMAVEMAVVVRAEAARTEVRAVASTDAGAGQMVTEAEVMEAEAMGERPAGSRAALRAVRAVLAGKERAHSTDCFLLSGRSRRSQKQNC